MANDIETIISLLRRQVEQNDQALKNWDDHMLVKKTDQERSDEYYADWKANQLAKELRNAAIDKIAPAREEKVQP